MNVGAWLAALSMYKGWVPACLVSTLCGHRVSCSKKAYQITVVHVEPYMAMWNCPALAAIYRKIVEQAWQWTWEFKLSFIKKTLSGNPFIHTIAMVVAMKNICQIGKWWAIVSIVQMFLIHQLSCHSDHILWGQVWCERSARSIYVRWNWMGRIKAKCFAYKPVTGPNALH